MRPGVYFTEVVKKARRTHLITDDIAESLFAYARLRNAISHDRYKDGEPIADPRADVVEKIEGIRDVVTADTRVVSILGHTEVVTLTPATHLDEVLAAVRKTGYARFPVYDGDKFVYLLTVQAIAKWLANDLSDNNTINATTVADVQQYLSASDRAELVAKDVTAPQALTRFNKLDDSGHSPAALIITEHGRPTQRPIQIVVASDIPRLLAAVDY
nr:CBS domain-containing protein [Corynebacterium mendelii]